VDERYREAEFVLLSAAVEVAVSGEVKATPVEANDPHRPAPSELHSDSDKKELAAGIRGQCDAALLYVSVSLLRDRLDGPLIVNDEVPRSKSHAFTLKDGVLRKGKEATPNRPET
jgi:hypothetical protein